MKVEAAVLEKIGEPLVLRQVDVAEPEDREVLVEVKASGICHSDLISATAEVGHALPLVLGHEVAGVVRRVGPKVDSLKVGDHVVACRVGSCGSCHDCISGNPYRCQHPEEVVRNADQAPRVSLDGLAVESKSTIGGFMDHVLLHENALVSIDKDMPFDKASVLGCAVATGAGAAINTAEVRVGDTVAVIGCGGVGLSAIQGAALAGARRIIAVDILDNKLELAKRFGATHVVNSSHADPTESVRSMTGGIGVDAAFECAGLLPTTRQAIDMTRPTGVAYLIGIHDVSNELTLRPFADLLMAKKSIRSVFMGSTNFKRDIPNYVDFYLQGRFNLDDLVSRTIDLADVNAGLEDLRRGEVARTVVTF